MARAGPIGITAFSAGALNVRTDTSTGLAVGATGDVCAYAEAGGVIAGPANRTLPPPPPSVLCGIAFTTPPASTLGILQPGQGILGVPKFPPPPGTGAASGIGLVITTPAATTSRASATWNSTETVGFFSTDRTASLFARANVTNAGAAPPGGIAASESRDPWFFTPDEDSLLLLTVKLTDVELVAQATGPRGSVAAIETTGAFGSGTEVGQNVLASWSFAELISGNGSFSLPEMILLSRSFELEADTAYWMSAELRTYGRVRGVPEPSALLLMLPALSLAGRSGVLRRRADARRQLSGPNIT